MYTNVHVLHCITCTVHICNVVSMHIYVHVYKCTCTITCAVHIRNVVSMHIYVHVYKCTCTTLYYMYSTYM